MQHVSRDENIVANDMAQQASGFHSNQGNLLFWKNRMSQFAKLDVLVFSQCAVQKSVLLNLFQQN
jgi:hypothetical protein